MTEPVIAVEPLERDCVSVSTADAISLDLEESETLDIGSVVGRDRLRSRLMRLSTPRTAQTAASIIAR